MTNGSSNIERASMDGTGRMTIHSKNFRIIDFTLDYSTQILYWVNLTGHVESSNIDGTSKRLLKRFTQSVYSVDFFGSNLYIAHYSSVVQVPIMMANTTQTINNFISICTGRASAVIKVISEARQLPGNSHNVNLYIVLS